MSEWKQISLGNLVESISKRHAFNKDRLIFLNTSDIFNGKVLNNEYTDINTLPGQAKKSIQKNDILFSEIRPANRRFAYIDFESEDYVVSTKLMVLRPKNNDILPKYLYYFLTSEESLRHLQEVAESRSGTFPQITFSEVKEMVINLPPLKEQQRIVEVIDSLTEKIELNLKINETLEEMAMTLYKHWFVENGDIEKVSIEEFGSIIGGGTPKTTVAEYWDGNIPWISVKDLNSAVIIETEKKITEAGLNNSSTKLLPPFSTVLSARGTIGNISIIGKEMTMNQSCYAIKAKDELDCFVFLTLKSSINTLISQSHGSVFNTITKDTLKSLELPFNKDFAIKFEKKVKPMFLQILSNTLENKELQDIRDYLLPRLLSGEIDLSKAEKQVEEVL